MQNLVSSGQGGFWQLGFRQQIMGLLGEVNSLSEIAIILHNSIGITHPVSVKRTGVSQSMKIACTDINRSLLK
jgi:hypothetical protein